MTITAANRNYVQTPNFLSIVHKEWVARNENTS